MVLSFSTACFTFDIAAGAGAKRGLGLSLFANCVCPRNSPRPSWRTLPSLFFVGEQLLDARALLHALEMRRDVGASEVMAPLRKTD
jgi:hypothetical protein